MPKRTAKVEKVWRGHGGGRRKAVVLLDGEPIGKLLETSFAGEDCYAAEDRHGISCFPFADEASAVRWLVRGANRR